LIEGPDCELRCLPWLYGDHTNPSGDYCKLCWNNFKYSGFKDEYGNISKFFHAAKADATLTEQFGESRGQICGRCVQCAFMHDACLKSSKSSAVGILSVLEI
jgi:hypothetical protein